MIIQTQKTFINFYLFLNLFIGLALATDIDCDVQVIKDLFKIKRDYHKTLKLNFWKLTSFFERLQLNLRDIDPICPNIGHRQKPKKCEPYLPSSCAEVMGKYEASGIRKLHVPGFNLKPFYAYCQQDPKKNGSAWTVILRRQDGSINFNHTFADYQSGFGEIGGEYWIGLDAMHAMTYFQPHELWMQVRHEQEEINAWHTHFAVNDEKSGYVVSALGPVHQTGNKKRSRTQFMSGNRFSTRDRDFSRYNCPKLRRGAWWYFESSKIDDEIFCSSCNLAADYTSSAKITNFYGGIHFNREFDHEHIQYALMAIRPLNK